MFIVEGPLILILRIYTVFVFLYIWFTNRFIIIIIIIDVTYILVAVIGPPDQKERVHNIYL